MPRPQAWDANTLTCLRTLEGHEDNVRVLAVGHGCLFSGSWDKTVRVSCRALLGWVRKAGGGAMLRQHRASVRGSRSGHGQPAERGPGAPHTLAAPCALTSLPPPRRASPQVWSAETLTCTKVLEGHNEAVLALAVGDLFMASGSYDTTIRWELGRAGAVGREQMLAWQVCECG